jgi:hypothetical protein
MIVFLLVILTVVAIFSVQNAMPVTITLFSGSRGVARYSHFPFCTFRMIAGAIIISPVRFKPSGKKEPRNIEGKENRLVRLITAYQTSAWSKVLHSILLKKQFCDFNHIN